MAVPVPERGLARASVKVLDLVMEAAWVLGVAPEESVQAVRGPLAPPTPHPIRSKVQGRVVLGLVQGFRCCRRHTLWQGIRLR